MLTVFYWPRKLSKMLLVSDGTFFWQSTLNICNLVWPLMYCKLHDVCDVKTFEILCFGKLLFGKNLFIPKRSLRENFKILLIINNSSPLFYSPSFLCKSQKRIFHNMKSEKRKENKSHLVVYILIKRRKVLKFFLLP